MQIVCNPAACQATVHISAAQTEICRCSSEQHRWAALSTCYLLAAFCNIQRTAKNGLLNIKSEIILFELIVFGWPRRGADQDKSDKERNTQFTNLHNLHQST
jgi:hypothetical protein